MLKTDIFISAANNALRIPKYPRKDLDAYSFGTYVNEPSDTGAKCIEPMSALQMRNGTMDTTQVDDPLKALDEIKEPDQRNRAPMPQRLSALHADLASINLHPGVPVDVRQHFETAKNVALYTWFVYRFHQVAEMQAFASLEMALRIRIRRDSLPKPPKGLSKMVRYAIESGWVRNEGFSYWNRRATSQAYSNFILQKLREPLKQESLEVIKAEPQRQLIEVIANPSEFIAEHRGDYLSILQVSLHRIRNNLAHGSQTLHPDSASTLLLCADFINQLFPKPSPTARADSATMKP